jgi:hypothetical protein
MMPLLSKPGDDQKVTPSQWTLILEKLGVITCVARTGKGVKMVQAQMAKQADRAMIGQVRLMLNKIGFKIKDAMHAAGEPAVLAKGMDSVFGPFWKEVEKSLLDSFILETGFQFKEYRKLLGKHQAVAPSEPIEWMRATLLHAMEPCDLSFFGRIRNPLYFCIFMTFLFPLYGVDSICVIIYWLCQKKVDEFQLVNFIIKSKGLQFLTGGLLSGALGFVKLFRCATVADPTTPTGCWMKAPGVTKTFRFEFSLLLVRCLLVWITFILLFNFDHIERISKKRQAEAATSDPRRGLFSPTKTAGLMAINWILLAINVAFTVKNIKDGSEELGLNATDTVALNLLVITMPLNMLLNVRRLRWYPAFGAALLAIGAISYVLIKYVPLGGVLYNQWSLIISAAYALPIYAIMGWRQKVAMDEDKVKIEALQTMLKDLDADGDGQVSKKELKVVFRKLFPHAASFDELWDELDSDGSGSLTTKELANHFGMGHLVQGTKEEEEAELKKLSGGIGSMAEIEAQLEELSSSDLSGTAGGVMTYFLFWDVAVIVGLAAYFYVHTKPFDWNAWQVSATMYFCKMVLGLCCFPFLVFKLPLITDALTHTRRTGYDRSGACVPLLPGAEKKRRFANKYMEKMLHLEAMKTEGDTRTCEEKITDTWNGILGASFTPQQTYKMINKKYGPTVAKKFKPKAEKKAALTKVVVEKGDAAAKTTVAAGKKAHSTVKDAAVTAKDGAVETSKTVTTKTKEGAAAVSDKAKDSAKSAKSLL